MENINVLKEKLREKLDGEYKMFLEELKKESFETIVERAYEIMSKQEIKDYIESKNLDESNIKALLKHNDILKDLYSEWLKTDGNFYSAMEDTINERIDEIAQEHSQKSKKNCKER